MTQRTTRRAALQSMGQLALLMGAHGVARGASIVAVRLWPALDYTRVTIESDQALQATHLLTQAPQRLVVDISNLELSPALRELVGAVRADDPFISGVRVGQFQPRVVRLVFDLKQPVRPEQFTLAPVAAYRHRLVFDLFPVQEADPLLALIRDKEAAEQRASQTVQDALSELIARIDKPQIAAAPQTAASAMATPPLPVPPPAVALNTPAPVPPALLPAPATAEERRRVDRLVIVALDPGHGGEDPGAIGPTGLREKDVVLAVALQLRDKLNAMTVNGNGMRVMMTRDADFFVPLQERVRKARRVQADLFMQLAEHGLFWVFAPVNATLRKLP